MSAMKEGSTLSEDTLAPWHSRTTTLGTNRGCVPYKLTQFLLDVNTIGCETLLRSGDAKLALISEQCYILQDKTQGEKKMKCMICRDFSVFRYLTIF